MKTKKNTKKRDFAKQKGCVSIKYRLIIAFIVFAIFPLMTVNILFSNMSSRTLEDTSRQFANQLISQICTNVNYFLTEIEQRNLTVALDPRLNNLLDQYDKVSSVEQAATQRELKQKILGIEITGGDSISNVLLLLNNGDYIGNLSKITKEELLSCQNMDSKDTGIWIKGMGNDAEGLYYIRNVNTSTNTARKKLGTLVTRIKMDKLIKDTQKVELFKGSNFYILDQNNEVIHNADDTNKEIPHHVLATISQDKMFGSNIINQSMVTYETAKNGWKVIFELPEKALTSKLDQTKMIVSVLIIVTVLLAIIFGVIVSQSFSKPIIKMMNLMKAAEKGDIKVQIESVRHDEIGLLCNSFNTMIDNMRKLIKQTKLVMGETLEDSTILERTTKQSVEASEQLSSSIRQIAVGATHQAEDAEKSRETMYALSESIQQVMVKTQTMVSENKDAKEMIHTATDSIEELNETMSSSIQTSHAIRAAILELSELTTSIEGIMQFIDCISEETNLLALNASIEAARAGEVGKGFAVVASEVRNLAEQSKRSTINVRSTLNTIKRKTTAAAKLVTNAHQVFSNQEQVVKGTHMAFDQVINKLKNIDNELNEVSEEATGMETLKDAMISQIERMGTITEDTASTSKELSAVSEEQGTVINLLFDISKKLTYSMNELNIAMSHFDVG